MTPEEARDTLVRIYNQSTLGRLRPPDKMFCGSDLFCLYEQYVSDLKGFVETTDIRGALFKGVMLYPEGDGFDARVEWVSPE